MHVFSDVPGLWAETIEALSQWRKWWGISIFDIRRQYLFTVMGPFWLVGSNLLFVVALSLLYSSAFDLQLSYYLPHFGIGYIIWTMIMDSTTRGANVFVTEYAQISQIRVNLLGVILKSLFARMVVFLANLAVIVILVAIVVGLDWQAVMLVPGLIILAINSFLQSYWSSALSTRFRDVPMILSNIMRIGFFLTPILWSADNIQIALRATLVLFNPFYYMIEIVRAPIQGGMPSAGIWIGAGLVTLLNLLIFILVFKKSHTRIAYEAA